MASWRDEAKGLLFDRPFCFLKAPITDLWEAGYLLGRWEWALLGESSKQVSGSGSQDSPWHLPRRGWCLLPPCSTSPLTSLPPPDTPSSPYINRVEPYSSSAQVEFDEPEATGGVPILKYKAEWRVLGEEEWRSRWYDAKEGKGLSSSFFLCLSISGDSQCLWSMGISLPRVPAFTTAEPLLVLQHPMCDRETSIARSIQTPLSLHCFM